MFHLHCDEHWYKKIYLPTYHFICQTFPQHWEHLHKDNLCYCPWQPLWLDYRTEGGRRSSKWGSKWGAIVYLCWFRLDRPTLIFVNRELFCFLPLAKCLILCGLYSLFVKAWSQASHNIVHFFGGNSRDHRNQEPWLLNGI